MNKEWKQFISTLRKTAFFLIVAGFFIISTNVAQASDLSNSLQNLYNQKSTVNKEIKEKSQAAKEKKDQAQDLTKAIGRLEGDISETESRINSLERQISQTQQDIKDTEGQISQKEQELTKENVNKENTLVELYQTGRQNFWELLISVKNLSEAINHNHYFEALESKLEATIEKITKIKTELEGKKSELDKKKAELAALKGEQEAYKQSLEGQKKEKAVVLDDTKVQQKKFEEQVEEAKKLNSQVEAQIASIQASIRNSNPNRGTVPRDRGTSPVGFSWPLDYKYISCYYGESTPFQSFHTGIDLVNIPGTPVYAASGGTVITATDMMIDGHYYGYGKYVVIGHNAKFSSLYGHLMSYIVSPGQEVQKGDIIGFLGNTGWSTGPHLHFEVWDNGNRVDPIGYLP